MRVRLQQVRAEIVRYLAKLADKLQVQNQIILRPTQVGTERLQ